jgi:hypothetical protein
MFGLIVVDETTWISSSSSSLLLSLLSLVVVSELMDIGIGGGGCTTETSLSKGGDCDVRSMAIIVRSGLAALVVTMAGSAAAVDAIGVLLLVVEGSDAFPLVGVIVETGIVDIAEICAINIDDDGGGGDDGDGDDVTSGERRMAAFL